MSEREWIECRLREWAQWISAGQRGEGYPGKSVLHQSWMPPDAGSTPVPKVTTGSQAELWRTHEAIATLPKDLRNTLALHYVWRLPTRQMAQQLKCSISTVYARLITARFKVKLALQDQD